MLINEKKISLLGIDDRWPSKGRLSFLPGIFHGSISLGGAEDDFLEGDHCGHAKTTARLSHQLPGHAAAYPDR